MRRQFDISKDNNLHSKIIANNTNTLQQGNQKKSRIFKKIFARSQVSSSVTYTEGIPERMRHSGYIQYTYRRRRVVFSSVLHLHLPEEVPETKKSSLENYVL